MPKAANVSTRARSARHPVLPSVLAVTDAHQERIKSDLLDLHDVIDKARHLTEAISMAARSCADRREASALNAMVSVLDDHLVGAGILLQACRKECGAWPDEDDNHGDDGNGDAEPAVEDAG